jgi:hypothetical protein
MIEDTVAWLHKQKKKDLHINLQRIETKLGRAGNELFKDIKEQYFNERRPIEERKRANRERYRESQQKNGNKQGLRWQQAKPKPSVGLNGSLSLFAEDDY